MTPAPSPRRVATRIAAVALLVSGCSQLQLASAGPTACAPKEIEISNVQRGWKEESWQATCKDTTFQCSQVATAWAVDVTCTKVAAGGAEGPVRDEAKPGPEDDATPTPAKAPPAADDEAPPAEEGGAPEAETGEDAAAGPSEGPAAEPEAPDGDAGAGASSTPDEDAGASEGDDAPGDDRRP